jgi:hypothetical protein
MKKQKHNFEEQIKKQRVDLEQQIKLEHERFDHVATQFQAETENLVSEYEPTIEQLNSASVKKLLQLKQEKLKIEADFNDTQLRISSLTQIQAELENQQRRLQQTAGTDDVVSRIRQFQQELDSRISHPNSGQHEIFGSRFVASPFEEYHLAIHSIS